MLEFRNVSKTFVEGFFNRKEKKVLDNVSLCVEPGEIVGLVGKSGCGKTTLARIGLRLVEPSSGDVILDGKNLTGMGKREMRRHRDRIQIVFQNPEAALNPKYSVLSSVAEGIDRAGIPPAERRDYFRALAEMTNLPEEILVRRPYQISGGELQRAVLARVLAVRPRYVVLDEPTSMLDVSVQANILGLIKRLKVEKGIGMLFISHDLDVIRVMCDRVAVMDGGRIVEEGDTEAVFSDPKSECTVEILERFY